eukprot:6180742-Pleurochrysis_carterae.AAC.1
MLGPSLSNFERLFPRAGRPKRGRICSLASQNARRLASSGLQHPLRAKDLGHVPLRQLMLRWESVRPLADASKAEEFATVSSPKAI